MSDPTLEFDAPMPSAYAEPPVDSNVIKSPTRSYQFVKFLGKGAYGKVYQGRVLEFGQVGDCQHFWLAMIMILFVYRM